MNIQISNEQELAFALENRLETLLQTIDWIDDSNIEREPVGKDRGFDFKARLRSQSGLIADLFVECKSQPRPALFPFEAMKRTMSKREGNLNSIPVLAAPAISQRMADLCLKHGWSWFDLAGNCLLNIPGSVWIERSGLRSKRKSPKSEANLGTAESARIIRAILGTKNLDRNWTQRELQETCSPSVSLGLVNKVVRYLKGQAYLDDASNKDGFQLSDPLGLLKEWVESYQFNKHRRANLFTLLKPKYIMNTIRSIELNHPNTVALAAFSAAEKINPHVRGESKSWIYVRSEFESKLRNMLETQEVDSGANISLIVPQDEGVFFDSIQKSENNTPTTSLVQTYVDLKQAGGRGEEAAKAILERQLKPLWKNAGLR